MRFLDVELAEVTEGGPALRHRGLRHHESSGQVEVRERTTERIFIPRSLSSLCSVLSVKLESEGTLKVVCAERGATYQPVDTSVRHLVASKLESPESGAGLTDLPEDRVVRSAANLQHRQAGRNTDKLQQSLLLSGEVRDHEVVVASALVP